MTATYTFDVFSSLDGFGAAGGNWTGYWGKQGPELLDHRLAVYGEEQRMVFGANTYRAFARMLASSTEESEVFDPWVTRMRSLPATVVSTTLEGSLDWPNANVVSGDAVDVVARLKEEWTRWEIDQTAREDVTAAGSLERAVARASTSRRARYGLTLDSCSGWCEHQLSMVGWFQSLGGGYVGIPRSNSLRETGRTGRAAHGYRGRAGCSTGPARSH